MNKILYQKQKSHSMNMVVTIGIAKLVASKFWRLGQMQEQIPVGKQVKNK